MMTVSKLRLVERKRLPCEPAAGWLVADFRWRLFSASSVIVAYTLLSFTHKNTTPASPGPKTHKLRQSRKG